MIKIGKLTDYALLITDHLVHTRGTLCTNMELSHSTHLPVATVRKLLKKLVDAGIVTSCRGANGGYKLADSPENISIAKVINAIEGPIAITECTLSNSGCDKTESCRLKTNWLSINRFFVSTLANISLADMSKPIKEQLLSPGHFLSL